MEGETNPEKREKEENQEREEARRKTQPMAKTCPVKQRAGQLFSRIESEKCLLIFRLWFEGWVDTTVLVKSPKSLFQDSPSLCISGDRDEVWHRSSSKKDGTLCPVSYSSALDHLRWSMDGMVDHEVDPLGLAEGFDAWEKRAPWDLESK